MQTDKKKSVLFIRLKFAFEMRFAHAHSHKTIKRHMKLKKRFQTKFQTMKIHYQPCLQNDNKMTKTCAKTWDRETLKDGILSKFQPCKHY